MVCLVANHMAGPKEEEEEEEEAYAPPPPNP